MAAAKSSTAIGDDQQQSISAQSAAIQILQKPFPGRLTFSRAAQKPKQMTCAIGTHSVGHQHLHTLAGRGTSHSETDAIKKQIRPFILQRRLMKATHRLIQTARQPGNGLRTDRLVGQSGDDSPHLTRDRQVRQVVHKNDPSLNWITATAFTGSDNEEAYLQFLNSFAQIEQMDTALGKAAGTLFSTADFNQNVAESQESGRNIIAHLREDLSFKTDQFDPATVKFYYVSFRRLKPGSMPQLAALRKDINALLKTANFDESWLQYDVAFGMPTPTVITVSTLKSLAEMDADQSSAYEAAVPKALREQFTSFVRDNVLFSENVIYKVKPELSHPSQALVAANPDFWTVKEPEQAPVVAKKKSNKKQGVEPAAPKQKAN